ncbi:MAG: ABC transporter ATP-binding protein [Gemmatimonadota bacterium]|nr:MAG: ABC transporter ATP-binding protein [Gemmatimonadota bacterium]
MTDGGADSASPPSVELEAIRKRFGPVVALDGVDLAAFPGEVHALVGENGAGKTTLMGVLSGVVRADQGVIRIAGRSVRLAKPRDAWASGIGMVHQHLTLVPELTVLENVALGVRSAAWGLRLPFDQVRSRLEALSHETGLSVDPDVVVERLSVGERQRVEILKVLNRDPRVLVLDEPTSVLAPREVEEFFHVLRGLAYEGRTVLLIAHKIDEILAVADRITVLRGGRVVHSGASHAMDSGSLAHLMIGRDVAARELPQPSEPGAELVRLEGVSARGSRGEVALSDVHLTVRRGEIVGVAGVDGNGQRELALLLAGAESPESGSVQLPDTVGFVPADRMGEALVPDFDLTQNVALALTDMPKYRRGALLRWGRLRSATARLMDRHGVGAPSLDVRAWMLSGGNQQKLVVGRELIRSQALLIAHNPTRGLDVAAGRFVQDELRRLSRSTKEADGEDPPGIVVISSDLDEVLELSDRLFVLRKGRLLTVPEARRTREFVGALMLAYDGDSGE